MGRKVWFCAGAAAAFAVVAVLVVLLRLASPLPLPVPGGSLHLAEVQLPTMGDAVVVSGDRANYMGQVQGVGYRLDVGRRVIVVERYCVRWSLFRSHAVHADWPLIIRKADLPDGTYEVKYVSSQGLASAGHFRVGP